MPDQMAFLPLSDVSESVKYIQLLLFFLLPEFIQPQMTVQISEAFVALVPRSVAIPGISSTCNGLLHVKVSRRYEFSRVLYQGLISRLSFLQFLSLILPLFLFASSFSSYHFYFSHELLVLEQRNNFLAVCDAVLLYVNFYFFLLCFICNVFVLSPFV